MTNPRNVASVLCAIALVSCGDGSGPTTAGGTIAMSTNLASGGGFGGDFEIYTLDLRSGHLTRLTTSVSTDTDPAYSPDGQRIAFSSLRSGQYRIYTMNAEGTDVRELSTSYGALPTWSPDGSTIAFLSDRPGISIMNADGSNVRLLEVPTGSILWPKWSPDGNRIAFNDPAQVFEPDGTTHQRWQIYTIGADGSDIQRLSAPNDDDRFPAYSPDGRQIVFSNCNTACRLFIMNADGSDRRQVTSATTGDFNPAWSPDGRQIAFMRFSQGGFNHVFVVDTDGGGLRQLTKGESLNGSPSWRP